MIFLFGSFGYASFSGLSLFVMPLMALGITCQVFEEDVFFNWNLSAVFLVIWLVMDFWKSNHSSIIFIASYQGYMVSMWLLIVDVDLNHQADVNFRSLHHKWLLITPFHILVSNPVLLYLVQISSFGHQELLQWDAVNFELWHPPINVEISWGEETF